MREVLSDATEAALLEEQKQFLESGKRPAAKVVRLSSNFLLSIILSIFIFISFHFFFFFFPMELIN